MDCDLAIVDDAYTWKPDGNEKRFEWEAGDVVYIPPNTISQHFNLEADRPAGSRWLPTGSTGKPG